MEQAIEIVRTEFGGTWLYHTKSKFEAVFRMMIALLRAVLIAMFVPSETDRKIEESRERVRRYLMRS